VELGRWWGGNPQTKTEAEIDIVAVDNKNGAIFCECKWTNEPVGAAALEKLMERSALLPFAQKFFYLFAKTGFAPGCAKLAEEAGNARLIAFAEMCAEKISL
jgi:hypothetical protein